MSDELFLKVCGLNPEECSKYTKVSLDIFRGDKIIHHQYSRELLVDKISTVKDIETQLSAEYIGECDGRKVCFLHRESPKKKIKKTLKKERRSKKIDLPPTELGELPKPEPPKKKDGGEDNIVHSSLATYY